MIGADGAAHEIDAARAAYEGLRQHVLAGAPLGAPLGLMLLLRQGVAAWLQGRSATEGPDGLTVSPKPRALASAALDEIQAGLVRVLAAMALVGRRKA